jgi:2-polyprenyl-3-methyl-5-hydroxy-6-metoxy-1,4-benzoquinol methylase
MNDDNQIITLNTYENKTHNYIERTPNKVEGWFKEYLDKILTFVSKDSEILEVGSATGRDADYMETEGYRVIRTDVVQGFIDYQSELNKEIFKFNVINDNLNRKFDLIIATAVFLHLDEKQFRKSLLNVKKHLNYNGLFAITLKKGSGEAFNSERMDSDRFFKYWEQEEFENILKEYQFDIKYSNIAEDDKWIQCIACI